MGLSVQLLEVTHQVLVEGAENIRKELLELYFENEGGEVESVVLDEDDQSAIITFKEQKGMILRLAEPSNMVTHRSDYQGHF